MLALWHAFLSGVECIQILSITSKTFVAASNKNDLQPHSTNLSIQLKQHPHLNWCRLISSIWKKVQIHPSYWTISQGLPKRTQQETSWQKQRHKKYTMISSFDSAIHKQSTTTKVESLKTRPNRPTLQYYPLQNDPVPPTREWASGTF